MLFSENCKKPSNTNPIAIKVQKEKSSFQRLNFNSFVLSSGRRYYSATSTFKCVLTFYLRNCNDFTLTQTVLFLRSRQRVLSVQLNVHTIENVLQHVSKSTPSFITLLF
jgi:hypothetical protein